MSYEKAATTATPALIVYLIDMSASMGAEIGGRKKIDVVSETLWLVAREMVVRSTKGRTPAPRYRIAIFAYNEEVRDLFGGAIPITELISTGIPIIKPGGLTDTAAAFEAAEQLLIGERVALQGSPAPMICHLTDGEYNGADPRPIVNRIRQLTFPDGAVLVENIFFDGSALRQAITDPYTWPGVTAPEQLASDTARHLYEMSSPVPASYHQLFVDRGYSIDPRARMLFSGDSPEILEAAFTMSGMTQMT